MSHRIIKIALLVAALIAIAVIFITSIDNKKDHLAVSNPSKPALTVTIAKPEKVMWSEILLATGSVLAWQEIIVGSEIGGMRLAEIQVNIGDRVKKGEVLAYFAVDTVLAEMHQQQAAFDEAKARYHEAQSNAQRAKQIKDYGVMSAQELQQFATTAEIAEAQMKLADAHLESTRLKLRYTQVIAPDDGLVSARNATVGSVVPIGTEMFRLIRRGKLEWRAELNDVQMQQVRVGQNVRVRSGTNDYVHGRVTHISPTIDMQTRNGYVYIGLPDNSGLKAGMFIQGEFDLGKSYALTLPQSAVVTRDGYSYVYRIATDGSVSQVKVVTGRRQGDRIEIIGNLSIDAAVATRGVGFLKDGDLVRIVPIKEKLNSLTE